MLYFALEICVKIQNRRLCIDHTFPSYCPQTKFLHLSVSHSVHKGVPGPGGWVAGPGGGGVCSKGGCLVQWGGGLLRGVPGWGVPGPGCLVQGRGCGDPLSVTATAEGGTHPTRMHSCLESNFNGEVNGLTTLVKQFVLHIAVNFMTLKICAS